MTSTLTPGVGTTDNMLLSQALKIHTAEAHQEAETASFMTQLLRGDLGTSEFIRLQEQSWLFYTALETAARACGSDPRAGQILDPRLERTDALAYDLDVLHGHTHWRGNIHPTPATAAYVQRLDEVAGTGDFPRLLAHHYVRYLGDLSGGQIIARMMTTHYGIGEDALTFYRFNDLGKLKPYRDSYRAALDRLTFTGEERGGLLREASDAFAFNQNVFASLG